MIFRENPSKNHGMTVATLSNRAAAWEMRFYFQCAGRALLVLPVRGENVETWFPWPLRWSLPRLNVPERRVLLGTHPITLGSP